MPASSVGSRRRVILASASPARLATLRAAGVDPEVIVSGVDESDVDGFPAPEHALVLARRKADHVAKSLAGRDDHPLVLGCDSVLELDGEVFGKPGSAEVARERWRRMRGRTGVLHSGHCVVDVGTGRTASGTASTVVRFAALSDREIDAYVATGEPLAVAGGFTVDGLGGPFVTGVEGDYHNVVGVSLPLLRELLIELEVFWPDLWRSPVP
ncbi:MAG TPA: nucleoside triphosphate pyrophosphatase [Actinopolymorphaceae bacterium]